MQEKIDALREGRVDSTTASQYMEDLSKEVIKTIDDLIKFDREKKSEFYRDMFYVGSVIAAICFTISGNMLIGGTSPKFLIMFSSLAGVFSGVAAIIGANKILEWHRELLAALSHVLHSFTPTKRDRSWIFASYALLIGISLLSIVLAVIFIIVIFA